MASTSNIAASTQERLQERCEILLRIAAVQERSDDPGYMSNVARMIVDEELNDIVFCTQVDEMSRGVLESLG